MSDYDFVLRVTRQTLFPLLAKYLKPSVEVFKERFRKNHKDITILQSKSRRIGFFQLKKHKNHLEIVRIFFSPAYQKKGLGKGLMQYFETSGYPKILLELWDNNPAYHFYRKIDYKVIKKENHKIHMEKRLR